MKSKKRILSFIVTAALTASLISGCNGGNKNQDAPPTPKPEQGTEKNATGFPIVDKPITLRMLVGKTVAQTDFDKLPVWVEYEKKTNIHIEWIQVDTKNLTERRNIMLNTGDIPDAFIKAGLVETDLLKYGQQGTFIAMNKLIEENAPNFKKILDDTKNYAEVKKDITMSDGNIYSLPYIREAGFAALAASPKMFVNRKWVDKVGMKMPITTDELYNVLKAFKEKDPNGNGKPDEIPWTGAGLNSVVTALKGAWGLNNRGSRVANIDFDETAKKVRFVPTDPRYKELLEYTQKLYKEGLIDQEIFTTGQTEIAAKGKQNLVGAFNLAGHTFVGPEHQDEFEGIPAALKGPHGDQIYNSTMASVMGKGSFVISNKNKYPAETMRWVDYFYSEEGMRLFFMGIEGESYRVNAQGECEFTEDITNNKDGLSFDQAVHKYVPYGGGGNPSIASEKYFKGVETLPIAAEAGKRVQPYLVKEVWNAFNFTPEENDVITSLGNDINKYVSEMMNSFVSGKVSFSEWDNYVSTLNKMGLDKYMKAQQSAYERYIKN